MDYIGPTHHMNEGIIMQDNLSVEEKIKKCLEYINSNFEGGDYFYLGLGGSFNLPPRGYVDSAADTTLRFSGAVIDVAELNYDDFLSYLDEAETLRGTNACMHYFARKCYEIGRINRHLWGDSNLETVRILL